ncbi:tRNA methyltransferase complex GCD14 subunit-domain-containing protein [Aspergillus coremiiformis]|uniref:tRNA (adenine(58)-N(1))-methyltransferase catalytic subunit TRM61 n=1 Tax=Aspergillus coremiiformis TaxID=138285 RepID=A0A5N6Z536_9EURO|nr:tRNA methyltransferase complex GCD14 subunit-domain-containing protein [Aspergillus coremiiformis]
MPSPFLTPGAKSQLDSLALLSLRRDQTIPTILQLQDEKNPGYKEGKVTNTRFGSFPHSTLCDQPWGSQIIASKVDTGSRGRTQSKKLKRKADELDSSTQAEDKWTPSPQTPVAAASGFLHLLYPTPELWTASLPHRTQVVYTPDYSYILHRLRARPGSTVIEAGAGSGSFTHASVRAVFNGYPSDNQPTKKGRLGKVCSFEFHAQRAGKVRDEVKEHGLEGLVEVTHRDVYEDGFLLGDPKTGKSPRANAIFLDLPAPWLALKHLVRNPPSGAESPLDPSSPVYICTFSPCLEQVQRTISTLRQSGWLGISMVEVNNRRIEVKRERVGLEYENIRGTVVFPKSVDEAVERTRAVEERSQLFRAAQNPSDGESTPAPNIESEATKNTSTSKPETETLDRRQEPEIPVYKQGRLMTRSEIDLKNHTSYLVFAVLPREWTEEDERRCREKWPSNRVQESQGPLKSKKQLKKEAKEQRNQEKQAQEQPETESQRE